MARKRYTAEQIIGYLRQAEVMVGQGKSISDVLREIDVTANTYYRWRKEYGGLGLDQAKRLKDLEQENARLKRVVADLSLDNLILKEVSTESSNQPAAAAGGCNLCAAETGYYGAPRVRGSRTEPRIATQRSQAP